MSALDFGLLRVQEEAYELSVLQELANSSTVLSPMQVCTSHTHTYTHSPANRVRGCCVCGAVLSREGQRAFALWGGQHTSTE